LKFQESSTISAQIPPQLLIPQPLQWVIFVVGHLNSISFGKDLPEFGNKAQDTL
jgi:hypothetical protein